MPIIRVILVMAAFGGMHTPLDAQFPGWQEMHVIEQDGHPQLLRAGEIGEKGREKLIVVNTRFSRLEIYRWVAPNDREPSELISAARPNQLASTPAIRREEVQLERLPHDLLVCDVDADGERELVILAAPPNRILVYKHVGDGFEQQYHLDLLEGSIAVQRQAMLVRDLPDGNKELLVSCADGIQQLALNREGRPHWLSPREKRDRIDWWLADIDGDGDRDLVEQTRQADEAIRWYECADSGTLLPAQVLFDRAISSAEMIQSGEQAELVLLDSTAQKLLRRYQAGRSDRSELGSRHALPLVGGKNAVWCGMQQQEQRALVVADPNRPQLLSYVLDDQGWQSEVSFPSVSGVQAMAAPQAQPGTVLLWTKDAADLHRCQWENHRLTYPKTWSPQPQTDQRMILGLGQVAATTWWVQSTGSHIDLYRWEGDESQADVTRFANVAKQATEAMWIGGDQLFVKDRHARGLRLLTRQDEEKEVASTNPSQLARADFSEFKLQPIGEELRLGRFVDGVLQWLDDDLQSYDQVMLPDGLELADYVATGTEGGWGLQKDGPFVHRLQADESGVIRSDNRLKVAGGMSLVRDPHLGLLLLNLDRITHLTEGTPHELQLVGMIDERIGRSGGVQETRFHRTATTDLDGDEHDELVLFDDQEHRLTAVTTTSNELTPLITWQVFDDKVYPYSDEPENLVREPRAVCGLDMDGDGRQDMAMLCHDRLLIYLARTQDPSEEITSE